LKLFIASVIILFGVVFFLFALFPSTISVSRIIRINAPADSVFREITDLRTWATWNLLIRDSRDGKDAKPISIPSADASRLISGDLTVSFIKKAADSIITRWQDRSGRSFTGIYLITESNGQAILQWNLAFHLRWYPWEKLASMFYDKQLGPLMEQSLLNLRKSLEPA
jgi:hypothetical protein